MPARALRGSQPRDRASAIYVLLPHVMPYPGSDGVELARNVKRCRRPGYKGGGITDEHVLANDRRVALVFGPQTLGWEDSSARQ